MKRMLVAVSALLMVTAACNSEDTQRAARPRTPQPPAVIDENPGKTCVNLVGTYDHNATTSVAIGQEGCDSLTTEYAVGDEIALMTYSSTECVWATADAQECHRVSFLADKAVIEACRAVEEGPKPNTPVQGQAQQGQSDQAGFLGDFGKGGDDKGDDKGDDNGKGDDKGEDDGKGDDKGEEPGKEEPKLECVTLIEYSLNKETNLVELVDGHERIFVRREAPKDEEGDKDGEGQKDDDGEKDDDKGGDKPSQSV